MMTSSPVLLRAIVGMTQVPELSKVVRARIRIAHVFEIANERVATNDVLVLSRDSDYMIHDIR
jgi:hypothetical protein